MSLLLRFAPHRKIAQPFNVFLWSREAAPGAPRTRCSMFSCDLLRLADAVQPGMYGRIVFPGRDNGSPRTRCVTRIVQAVILARLCGGIKFGEDLAKMERRKV